LPMIVNMVLCLAVFVVGHLTPVLVRAGVLKLEIVTFMARLIATILPDVLVKGGDYTPDAIAGGKAVLENGGIVEVLRFHEGRSTSAIVDSIRGAES
jgi:bifunctional ADP-heptose synthase (sugar kinase/adenylyltransferase)